MARSKAVTVLVWVLGVWLALVVLWLVWPWLMSGV